MEMGRRCLHEFHNRLQRPGGKGFAYERLRCEQQRPRRNSGRHRLVDRTALQGICHRRRPRRRRFQLHRLLERNRSRTRLLVVFSLDLPNNPGRVSVPPLTLLLFVRWVPTRLISRISQTNSRFGGRTPTPNRLIPRLLSCQLCISYESQRETHECASAKHERTRFALPVREDSVHVEISERRISSAGYLFRASVLCDRPEH